jgi:hypothetical protein
MTYVHFINSSSSVLSIELKGLVTAWVFSLLILFTSGVLIATQ